MAVPLELFSNFLAAASSSCGRLRLELRQVGRGLRRPAPRRSPGHLSCRLRGFCRREAVASAVSSASESVRWRPRHGGRPAPCRSRRRRARADRRSGERGDRVVHLRSGLLGPAGRHPGRLVGLPWGTRAATARRGARGLSRSARSSSGWRVWGSSAMSPTGRPFCTSSGTVRIVSSSGIDGVDFVPGQRRRNLATDSGPDEPGAEDRLVRRFWLKSTKMRSPVPPSTIGRHEIGRRRSSSRAKATAAARTSKLSHRGSSRT